MQFAKPDDEILTMAEFEGRYGFPSDGRNFYFGINQEAVDHYFDTFTALRPQHTVVLDNLINTLSTTSRMVLAADLSLFPLHSGDPFAFVSDNLELVDQLAIDLNAYQQQAVALGKQLDIVIRYASEMNDPATERQPYGRQPAKFRASFALVREEFRALAPAIKFSFSPALRSDIVGERYQALTTYWPGTAYVDYMSCTWYVGRESNLDGAIDVLRKYCLHRKGRGLPFGIDEMGGVNIDVDNDGILQKMFAALKKLADDEITFDYASLFLEEKWAVDATLDFISGP